MTPKQRQHQIRQRRNRQRKRQDAVPVRSASVVSIKPQPPSILDEGVMNLVTRGVDPEICEIYFLHNLRTVRTLVEWLRSDMPKIPGIKLKELSHTRRVLQKYGVTL